MIVIIILSGKAESGKDTFYEIAKREFKTLYIDRYSIGDEVKEIAKIIGWDGVKDTRGISFLQGLSECAMAYDQQIWTKKCVSKICQSEHYQSNDISFVIITDCRFRHQLDYIINIFNNVRTVRINRPGHTSSLTQNQTSHISETDLDSYSKWHFTINNDEDLDFYLLKVVDTMKEIVAQFSNEF